MSNSPICPCMAPQEALTISNHPGRDHINYRVGDYVSFRHALLRGRPGEIELSNWRPGASGDLAVQMVEWWAYLADILTFYNERIANQDYLRTADLPESVKRLILLLGYRLRPGIGATGTLAALLNSPKPITLPKGFQVQSKPGPGKQPQVFELDADTLVHPPDVVAADPAPDSLLFTASNPSSVLLQGVVSSIKVGDELLLLHSGWNGTEQNSKLVVVASVSPEKDPHGKTNTRVVFTIKPDLKNAKVKDYSLLRSTQTAHLWTFTDSKVITGANADLESPARQIKVGDPVLFVGPSPLGEQLASVISYSEPVWYVDGTDNPPTKPSPTAKFSLPIPHAEIQFKPPLNNPDKWNDNKQAVVVRYAWQPVGALIATPSTGLSGAGHGLQAVPPAVFPPTGKGIPVLIEDANGDGESALATGGPSLLGLEGLVGPPANLVAPLNVLFNLLSVSRGKTVSNEVLGSGDATATGQEFILQKSPLTYLLSGDSTSGSSYASTLQVWVDGVQWKEVPSFYGQPANARIFVTREDENNITHVQFGDGVNGARLSSGANNVVATYRYGSGKESPDAGSLTEILQPRPGLKAIRNPVPAGGGADPDSPGQIRKYAAQSVLNFGRAVSADDYETIAAQAPGVARARSYWNWDAAQQRALVTIYVGDDKNAQDAAIIALSHADDPNRPVVVDLARAVAISLSFALLVDPDYVAAEVQNAVTAALIDPDNGMLGANAIGIGQVIFESQIYHACLTVPGAVAIHEFVLSVFHHGRLRSLSGSAGTGRFDPGIGGFFQLLSANLNISTQVATHA